MGSVKKADLTVEIASMGDDSLRMMTGGMGGGILPLDDEILTVIAPSKLGTDGRSVTDCYSLYRRMRTSDAKLKSLIRTRKMGVLSKGMRVVPNADDPDPERAQELADFVSAAVAGISGWWRDLLELMDAIPVGFSVAEILWEERDLIYSGGSRTAWVPVELRQRRQGRFGFAADGSLRYSPEPTKWQEVPAFKFVVFSHSPENENQYGTSEASELFWTWWLKHNFVKWWAIFSEKWGQPTAVGKYPPNATEEEQKKLKAALRMIQSEYAIVMPENLTVDLLEAQRQGATDTYDRFVSWCDRCMSEALTGQSLATGQATTGTGTYSQAQTHADVKQEFVEGDARALMEVVNGQLVRPLVELNFGAGLPLPIWTIDYESKDLQAELELDSWLVGLGLELPRWYFYEKYKRPMPASDDEVVSGGSGVGWGGGWGPNAAGVGMGARMRGRDGHNGHNGHRGRDGRNCGEGVRRVKFAVAAGAMTEARRRRREMDGVFARIVTMGAGAVRALLSGVKGEAAAAGSLAELALRIERMKAERAGVDALTEAFATAKTGALCLGAAHVMRWVGGAGASAKLEDEGVQVHVHVHEKRGDERTRSVKGGRERMRAGVIADWEPVTPEQAIRWFLDLVPLTESDLEQLAAEARARSFTVADVESRELLTRIQERIGDFLREGRTLAEWQSEWAAMTSEWGLEGKSPWQVETMFRTETMRAYGAGRQLALNDPDIKEGFPAYQYIAILDDRTRETHAALHGFVADREDPVWDRITPPWDYNCRCDLIPLSVGSMKELGVYDAWAAATLPQTVRLGDGSERNPREFRGSDGFRGLGL